MVRQRRSLKIADLLGDDDEMLGERGDLGRAFVAALRGGQEVSIRKKTPFRRHVERGSTTVVEEDQAIVRSSDDVNNFHSQACVEGLPGTIPDPEKR